MSDFNCSSTWLELTPSLGLDRKWQEKKITDIREEDSKKRPQNILYLKIWSSHIVHCGGEMQAPVMLTKIQILPSSASYSRWDTSGDSNQSCQLPYHLNLGPNHLMVIHWMPYKHVNKRCLFKRSLPNRGSLDAFFHQPVEVEGEHEKGNAVLVLWREPSLKLAVLHIVYITDR